MCFFVFFCAFVEEKQKLYLNFTLTELPSIEEHVEEKQKLYLNKKKFYRCYC